MGDLKQVDPDKRRGAEELWEVEGGEAVFRLYCIRRKYMFNKRGRKEIHFLFSLFIYTNYSVCIKLLATKISELTIGIG